MEKSWQNRKVKENLANVLPLATPFSINFEPINACNFKCNYCVYASKEYKPSKIKLNFESFSRVIHDCNKFSDRIKSVSFYGFGEPLLNKELPKMIEKTFSIANEINIISNGLLLNKEFVDAIPSLGKLDGGGGVVINFRISLQGVNEYDYYKTTGTKIDFEKFKKGIEMIYKSRKCKVFLKAVNIDSEQKKQELFLTYEDICDDIFIENISPLFNHVDYSQYQNEKLMCSNNSATNVHKVCPQPFYSLNICANGDVYPCCQFDTYSKELCVGNINENSIIDIWNGNKLKNLRLLLLKNMSPCAYCTIPKYQYHPQKDIDKFTEDLILKYD